MKNLQRIKGENLRLFENILKKMSWVVCAGVSVTNPSFCVFMEMSQLSRYGSQEARNPEE